MKKSIFILLLATMFLFVGCASSTPPGNSNGEEEPAGQLTFAYLSPDQANPFWQRVAKGVQDEAAKQDIEIIVLDASHDPAKQLSQAEDAVNLEVDVVLVSPFDSDTGTAIVEVLNKAEIPVFILDIGSGGDYNALIISDNEGGGFLAGNALLEAVGADPIIFEMQGLVGRSEPAKRGDGFNRAMDENNVTVAAVQPANFLRSMGMDVMENVLMTNPDLNGLFAWNDEMALGALEAIAAAGKSDQITIVGFDGNQDAVQAVIDGKMLASVAQQPELFGELGVQFGLKELNGETYEKVIYVPVILITSENANDYLE